MEIGLDSFIAAIGSKPETRMKPEEAMSLFLDRIVQADAVGLDIFGVGEHHREEFLDSAPVVVLAAAAALTKNIRLTSAVTVLSAADPVRVFEAFATLDLISKGRAEIVAGRGSFIEAFPLFGLDLNDYDSLYEENLGLLLALREQPFIHWSGKHRANLTGQGVFPRPMQKQLPIWLGAGGTPASFARAGTLGLPLMIAIIGGETHRFRPHVDLYREMGRRAGHPAEQLKVGIHSFGYVSETSQAARDEFYPGYVTSMAAISKERGWPPATRSAFDAQCSPTGAYLIGGPNEVIEKIRRHSDALGGITRVTFQMDAGNLSQAQILSSIDLLGTVVAPALRKS